MNRELTAEYLDEILSFVGDNNLDVYQCLSSLFKDQDFIDMLEGKRFMMSNIKRMLLKMKTGKIKLNYNQQHFFAFLIIEFVVRTSIPINKIPNYLHFPQIYKRFNYYHAQDVDEIIFNLMAEHNKNYRIRKTSYHYFASKDHVLDVMCKLFPFKKFTKYLSTYDPRVEEYVHTIFNEVLVFTDDIDSLLANDYFVQKYAVGNKVYIFTTNEIIPKVNNYPTAIYLFVVKRSGIEYHEPGGLVSTFLFSN